MRKCQQLQCAGPARRHRQSCHYCASMHVYRVGVRTCTAHRAHCQQRQELCLIGPCRRINLLPRLVATRKIDCVRVFRSSRLHLCATTASETTSSTLSADMQVGIPELRQLCTEALQGLGYTDDHSQTITEVTLDALLILVARRRAVLPTLVV